MQATREESTANKADAASGAPVVGAALRANDRIERALVAMIICAVLAVTTVPYLVGYASAPRGGQFLGPLAGRNDYCVYLSWTRQAADGHFFIRNLFTTDPQGGQIFNLFFLLLGQIVHWTGWPLSVVLQIARVVGAGWLLVAIYQLYRFCLPEHRTARLTAFCFTAFGAGFGWLIWPAWRDGILQTFPVDVWQPEAFTFYTIYNSALLTVSTALIVCVLYNLLRCARSGQPRHAIRAGIWALILGNVHTYDIGQIAASWGLFLIGKAVLDRKVDTRLWLHTGLALAIALPAILYQVFVFTHDPIFHKRVDVGTWTPIPLTYIQGYGLPLFLAVGTVVLAAMRRGTIGESFESRDILLFAPIWLAATFLVIYGIHVPFQRRMVMGAHIPLALLAGVGAAYIVRAIQPSIVRRAALLGLIAVTAITNVIMVTRDIDHLKTSRGITIGTSADPFVTAGELELCRWIQNGTKQEETFVAPPQVAVLLPGYTGHAVWMGHWGETPAYQDKLAELRHGFDVTTSEAGRAAFLRGTHASYLIYPRDAAQLSKSLSLRAPKPVTCVDLAGGARPYLTKAHENEDYVVYAIR